MVHRPFPEITTSKFANSGQRLTKTEVTASGLELAGSTLLLLFFQITPTNLDQNELQSLASWLKQTKYFDYLSLETFIRWCQYSKNMAHYPCGVCEKSIDDSKQSSIFCDLCKFWVHTKCNQLNFLDFQHIKACTEPWFCFKCISDLFPFGTLNNQNFSSFVLNNKNSNANTGSSINLKPPSNLSLLFNQFNDLSSDSINKNPKNMMTNCK